VVVPRIVQYVYVLGQVARPGPLPLKSGDTLADALGRAGGPTALADPRMIVLLRNADIAAARLRAEQSAQAAGSAAKRSGGQALPPSHDEPRPLVLDMTKIGAGELAYKVAAGDLVYVPTRPEARSDYRNLLLSSLLSLAVGFAVRR